MFGKHAHVSCSIGEIAGAGGGRGFSAGKKKTPQRLRTAGFLSGIWLREPDLNRRPSGYEPDELPGCSTPHQNTLDCGKPLGKPRWTPLVIGVQFRGCAL